MQGKLKSDAGKNRHVETTIRALHKNVIPLIHPQKDLFMQCAQCLEDKNAKQMLSIGMGGKLSWDANQCSN